MGLLSKFMGGTPAKKPTDDVLLIHGIICMCAADGIVEDAEHEMIRNYANTLPEFRDMDGQEFSKCIEGSAKIAQSYIFGGYVRGGADKIAPLVDQVLGEQLSRLKIYLENAPN